jgi:protein-S-isoprenylcysteine O-methyltransferase Ste14
VPAETSGGRGDQLGARLPELGRRGEGWVAGQVVLMAGVFASPFLDRGALVERSAVTYAIGGTLLGLGLLLLVSAALQLGGSLTPLPIPQASEKLVTGGAFGLVRHPMYGGGILIALGWAIAFATPTGLVLALALGVFLALKAHREEAWLLERDPGYEGYREQTRHMLIPFLY